MRLVVLGRQGAGKGTQSARLALCLGAVHLSTGDAFRAAINAGSELGRRVGTFVAAGELVPDDLALAVVAEALDVETVRNAGFVLDGFPRTVRQAERLDALLAPAKIDAALDLRVDPNIALERLLRRRVCVECGGIASGVPDASGRAACRTCGGMLIRRADDTEPLIRRRLALYEEQTRPLLNWFAAKGILRGVEGNGPPELVARRVGAAISGPSAYDEGSFALSRMALESATR
jgi:adenylate kinase